MGEILNEKKIRLASWILSLGDETLLDYLEEILSARAGESYPDETIFARPIPENITVDDLTKAQHDTPIDKAKMDALADAIDIREPIDDLLAQLTP